VLRQLRKLPWGECSAYVAKVLGRVHKLQYANIHLVASLAAGFTKFHDDLPVTLVDQVGCGLNFEGVPIGALRSDCLRLGWETDYLVCVFLCPLGSAE
jgi:hypothetical protein